MSVSASSALEVCLFSSLLPLSRSIFQSLVLLVASQFSNLGRLFWKRAVMNVARVRLTSEITPAFSWRKFISASCGGPRDPWFSTQGECSSWGLGRQDENESSSCRFRSAKSPLSLSIPSRDSRNLPSGLFLLHFSTLLLCFFFFPFLFSLLFLSAYCSTLSSRPLWS